MELSRGLLDSRKSRKNTNPKGKIQEDKKQKFLFRFSQFFFSFRYSFSEKRLAFFWSFFSLLLSAATPPTKRKERAISSEGTDLKSYFFRIPATPLLQQQSHQKFQDKKGTRDTGETRQREDEGRSRAAAAEAAARLRKKEKKLTRSYGELS